MDVMNEFNFERLRRIMRLVDGLMKWLPELEFITKSDFGKEYAKEVYFDAKKARGDLAVLKECTLKPLYDTYKRQENMDSSIDDYLDGDDDDRNVKDF